jgi:hypothetical protein
MSNPKREDHLPSARIVVLLCAAAVIIPTATFLIGSWLLGVG